MRNRRKRPVQNKYSLAYLLSRQPKGMAGRQHYSQLIGYLRAENSLGQLRFGRKCYSLLHHAKISPETLAVFYRVYRLPRHPFFPLFLTVKQGYLKDCRQKNDARRSYIQEQIRKLPPLLLATIKYLAEFEKNFNHKKLYPLWIKHLYPGSKKKADCLTKYTWTDWADKFRNFLGKLATHYPELDKEYGNRIIALYILQLPLKKHLNTELKSQYRKLCKLAHPDTGGVAQEFLWLQWARDILLPES